MTPRPAGASAASPMPSPAPSPQAAAAATSARPGAPTAPAVAPVSSSPVSSSPATSGASAAPAPAGSHAARRAGRASTPTALRWMGAVGLLTGVLVGATGFAATTSAADRASETVTSAQGTDALDRADAYGARARAQAAGAALSRSLGTTRTASVDGLAQDLGQAQAAIVASGATGSALSTAVQAVPRYAAVVTRAGTDATGTASTYSGAAQLEKTWTEGVEGALSADRSVTQTTASAAGWPVRLWIVAGGGLGTAVLLGCTVWVARRTRRVINPPLVGAVLLSGLVTAGAVAVTVSAASTASIAAEQVSSSPTERALVRDASLLRESQAEDLLGSATGASTTVPADAASRIDSSVEVLSPEVRQAWTTYRASYARAQAADTPALASSEAATTGATSFDALMTALDQASPRWSAAAPGFESSPADGAWPWLLLGGGVAAGGLAVVGANLRLREYR